MIKALFFDVDGTLVSFRQKFLSDGLMADLTGKYVNFLDSDDKWTKNSFRAVYEFFEKQYDKIDLVSCPQKFFEARDEYHWLAFKYENGSRIIDVLEKYNYIQMHVTASFVKAEVLARHTFDEKLKFAEDSKFVNSVIDRKSVV